ncbi:hypothetical protein BJ684DRAFT_8159 [Piptocephalis cylindrospora]|uniref:ABC transporter domain-containing protein n=1 Tax=Piptocephalis cylindrospora TaxID=1907219 RepID=A0A4P9Y8K4_9FUNG|nr:hypothetical protein BJ684DRAFT_8159 [Piptocephalis cylindrospora]|eukprot:RKP14681.1 hypothetical protein BJ684DRAFT_8159 [Piptocephalis cylindrospora]
MATNATCYSGGQPQVISDQFTCADRFYCPNTTASNPASLPQACPPTQECAVSRLYQLWCPAQGQFEPVVCPRGYYCPDPQTMHRCPKGYFCPAGTTVPRSCGGINLCEEGTIGRVEITSIIVLIIVDALLFSSIFYMRWRGKKTDRKHQALTSNAALASSVSPNPFDASPGATVTTDPHSDEHDTYREDEGMDEGQADRMVKASALVSGFRRASYMPSSSSSKDSEASDPGRGGNFHFDFTFDRLGLTLPSGKRILRGVTGGLHSGRFTAIMGPSGAGKTTFLNVLLGKVNGTEGKVFINGVPSKIPQYKKLIGYVPQEDVMIRELTAREIIAHSAHTRLPRSWTKAEVETYVDAVLEALGLSAVASVPVGDEVSRGLSGGQRKRVNIGIELAAAPFALFLDEPTSGLDSTVALSLARTLRSVARVGLTVVSVIHQPRYEIFQAFDDVLLIAPGGFTCYHGPVEGSVQHFQSMGFYFDPHANPADILMDILSGHGEAPSDLSGATQNAHLPTEDKDKEEKTALGSGSEADEVSLRPQHVATKAMWKRMIQDRGASHLRQIWLCHQRSLLQQYRRPLSLIFEYGVAAIAGVLLGLAIMNRAGQLYIGALISPYTPLSLSPFETMVPQMCMLISMSISVSGSPAAVRTFGEEKSVYWREAASGHSKVAYFTGKVLSTLYRIGLGALHYTAFYHTISRTDPDLSTIFPLVLLQFFCVYGVSEIVSIIVSRANGPLLASILCLILSVFNGYGPNLHETSDWRLQWVWEMSYTRWFAEAYFFKYVEPYRGLYMVDVSADYYGYTLDRYGMDVALTFIIGVVLRILGYVALRMTNRQHQR